MQTKCNQLVGLNGGLSASPEEKFQVVIRYRDSNKTSIIKRDISFEEAQAIQTRTPDTLKYSTMIEKYDPSHFEKYWYLYGVGVAFLFIYLGTQE